MTIIKDYIDPTICPVCGAPNQEPYDYEVNSIEAQHYYCCSECDTDWVSVYELKPKHVILLSLDL